MIVYVETNFVLALAQEQAASCRQIVELAENARVQLVVPAYSLAEPYETLARRHAHRRDLQGAIDRELRELGRTESYARHVLQARELTPLLLLESAAEERSRLEAARSRIMQVAEVIPLGTEVLRAAVAYSEAHDLSAPDAIVYASVIGHRERREAGESCFLNRNSRDFGDPDLIGELRRWGCRMIRRFDDGLEFLRHQGGTG